MGGLFGGTEGREGLRDYNLTSCLLSGRGAGVNLVLNSCTAGLTNVFVADCHSVYLQVPLLYVFLGPTPGPHDTMTE